jgi:hypothetical protein
VFGIPLPVQPMKVQLPSIPINYPHSHGLCS